MADVGEIRARLILDTSQFTNAMRTAQSQMNNVNRTASRTSESINKIHKAAMGFGLAVGAVFAASVASAANFEQKMQDVKAVSGASGEEMTKLSDLAKDMGKNTAFSAAEAASGIEELIKAGVSVTDILGGGLQGALNLATAGGLGLGEAAEIASTALNAFKKDNLSVAEAADILAGAANASATDVGELKYGLSMVSAVASGVGLSFKDTNTALAIFAQNGLKGSDAGTSLKTMLLNLSPTSKKAQKEMKELGLMTKEGGSAFYDAQGHIKSMGEIAEILKTKLSGLTDEQRQFALKTMFGTDAIRAANILYKEGAKGLDDMWGAMSKVKAADVAKTKLDSLKGSFTLLKSALESAGIKIGENFLPALTQVARKVTGLISSLDDADMANINAALAFAGTAAAIAIVGSSIAKLVLALRTLFLSMGPTGWLIISLSLIGGLFAAGAAQASSLDDAMMKNIDTQFKQQKAIDENVKAYDDLRMKAHLTTDEFARYLDIQSELQKTTDPQKIADLTAEQEKLREKSGLSNDELDKMVQLNGDLIEKVPKATTEITKQGNAVIKNTDAIKKYSKEKLDSLYAELDLQRLKTESAYRDKLEEEDQLVGQINKANQKKEQLIKNQTTAHSKFNEEQAKLIDMQTHSSSYTQQEIDQQRTKVNLAKDDVNLATDRLSKQAATIEKKQKELDTTRKELKEIENIKTQMGSILLAQNGLTAKKGEEVKVIDSAISKLEKEKKTLQETTPINQRNTGQYKEAVDAIQSQINKLNTTKSKLIDLTGQASRLNDELRKSIYKNIYQNVISSGNYNNYKANALKYHTGGIVGQLPKLHVGGLASQFASLPSHNEVDVRLLRNEAVFTEAQQANLMRIIDAGFTPKKENDSSSSIIQQNYITVQGDITRDLYDEIMGRQMTEMNTKLIVNGVKG